MIKRYKIRLETLLLFVLGVLLFSCNEDRLDENRWAEGQEFTYTSQFSITAAELVSTRSTETALLESLRLLVFDENNRFLYSREAVLSGYNHESETFGYSVKLISSSKSRTIHFVANYDWTGFEQDYFLEGLDAGSIIGKLVATKCAYWMESKLSSLDKKSLEANKIQLWSNQSLISLSSQASDFRLEGFKAYNMYDRGTVASFVVDEQGQISFNTEINRLQPTVPSNYSMNATSDFSQSPIKVFERFATNGHPLFVLVKGNYKGKNSYYKVDLKRFNASTGVTQLYDILRNHKYSIRINRVTGPGYDTEEDASKAPASNNIFASQELEDYNSITNGTHELEVGKLAETIVRHPTTFETKVQYSLGVQNLSYYPSWGENDDYLYPLDKNELSKGIIRVKTKKIPSDRRLTYTIDIVASPGEGKDIITRRVKIILDQPYNFRACHKVSGGEVSVYFTLVDKLDDSVYPLDIYISAKELTPIPSKNGSNMVLVYQDGGYSYKFTCREKPSSKEQVLYFKRNNPKNGLGDIFLNCYYFNDDNASKSKKID